MNRIPPLVFTVAVVLFVVVLSVAAADRARLAPDLEMPFKVVAGSGPIDVEIGHAAPFLADLDRDGLVDLLVGQFGSGRLRIYRNTGKRGAPSFDGFTLFQAGGAEGTVPAG